MAITVSDTCLVCGDQIWLEEEVWIDNSGGDVCDLDEPHNASGDEILTITREKR
jgi:hypothetical protein